MANMAVRRNPKSTAAQRCVSDCVNGAGSTGILAESVRYDVSALLYHSRHPAPALCFSHRYCAIRRSNRFSPRHSLTHAMVAKGAACSFYRRRAVVNCQHVAWQQAQLPQQQRNGGDNEAAAAAELHAAVGRP